MSVAGGCRCGAVRYTLAVETLPAAYACHCLDCQIWSGSAFSQQVLVTESALTVSGPIIDYRFQSPSGARSHQRMCGVCHARVYNTSSTRRGVAVVRAGTLDQSDRLQTPLHIWTRRKQPWLILPPGVQSYAEAAPPEAIIGLLATP